MPMLRVNSGTTNKKTGQDCEEARCHAPIEARTMSAGKLSRMLGLKKRKPLAIRVGG
jgi:hypothetical protein